MSATSHLPTLHRLADQFAAAVAEGSEVHDTAAFRVHLWPAPDPFYRNVAIPRLQPAAWAPAIAEMRRLFLERRRSPRLEFFAELWPGLAAALEEQGFVLDRAGPVMICDRPSLSPPLPDMADVTLLHGDMPPSLLSSFLEGAAEAFGEPAGVLAEGEIEQLRDGLARGSIRTAAVFVADRAVAGASLVGNGPVVELAGVWTAAAHRRRGHAAAACHRLLTDLFAHGGESAWLSAGNDESCALYRKLGFVPIGTQLNYGWQPTTAS